MLGNCRCHEVADRPGTCPVVLAQEADIEWTNVVPPERRASVVAGDPLSKLKRSHGVPVLRSHLVAAVTSNEAWASLGIGPRLT